MPCHNMKSKNYKVSNSTENSENTSEVLLNNGNLTLELFIFYVQATTANVSQRVFDSSNVVR